MAHFDREIAETVMEQMMDQHPDVVAGATPEVLANWGEANYKGVPWLQKFAEYNELEMAKVFTANMCFCYQWGIDFEQLNRRPPNSFDWQGSYFDRCNLFAERLGALPPFDKPDYRLRPEYGGPY